MPCLLYTSGQELQYPGERTAAVVIDNAASSTTQWGIGSASVVLEALTESGQPTSLCLAYPSVSAMPTVGPVTLGQDLYWRLLSGQEVLPIQRGAGQFARNYLDYYNLRAVDALEVEMCIRDRLLLIYFVFQSHKLILQFNWWYI